MGGRRQKYGVGGAAADPIIRLVATLIMLPLVGLVGVSTPRALDGLGFVATERLRALLWALTVAVSACLGASVVRKLSKLAWRIFSRSRALKHLPGPDYGWLGILPLLCKRRDLHRLVTAWAEAYGPIVRVRFLIFHVRRHSHRTACPWPVTS